MKFFIGSVVLGMAPVLFFCFMDWLARRDIEKEKREFRSKKTKEDAHESNRSRYQGWQD
jgi:hypothetical protein